MHITALLARRLRDLRALRRMPMEALAERSGVSRSMISLIERGESSPTAAVLDKLARALDVSLASLFEPDPAVAPPSPLALAADQPTWTDPASGYLRRHLSPALPSPLRLIEVVFPAGAQVTYDNAGQGAVLQQQVWMLDGRMRIGLGEERWLLQPGDCLAMRLHRPSHFHNPGTEAARYLVALHQPAGDGA